MWQPVTDIQDIRQPTEEDKGEGSPFISEEAFDWLDLFIDSCDKGCCNPEALKFIPLDKAVAAVQLTLPAFEHTPTVKGTGVKASRWTRSKVNSGKHTLETEDKTPFEIGSECIYKGAINPGRSTRDHPPKSRVVTITGVKDTSPLQYFVEVSPPLPPPPRPPPLVTQTEAVSHMSHAMLGWEMGRGTNLPALPATAESDPG